MHSRIEQVYRYIVQYKMAHDGNSPTIRQIGDACDIPSTSQVRYYLDKLCTQNRLRKLGRVDESASRAYAVVGGKWSMAT